MKKTGGAWGIHVVFIILSQKIKIFCTKKQKKTRDFQKKIVFEIWQR